MIRVAQADEPQGSLLPDLTPLLDVIFIVLVFLMFSANTVPMALPVDLPKAGAEQAEAVDKPKTVAVNLLNSGEPWAIDSVRYEQWDQFSDALLARREADPELSVVVAGDRDVPMEKLVQLLGFLQAQEWSAASIMMEKEQK